MVAFGGAATALWRQPEFSQPATSGPSPPRSKFLSRRAPEGQVSGAESEPLVGPTRPAAVASERQLCGISPGHAHAAGGVEARLPKAGARKQCASLNCASTAAEAAAGWAEDLSSGRSSNSLAHFRTLPCSLGRTPLGLQTRLGCFGSGQGVAKLPIACRNVTRPGSGRSRLVMDEYSPEPGGCKKALSCAWRAAQLSSSDAVDLPLR